MTPADVKTIYELLVNRVQTRNALEGEAIMALARRLVEHFAKQVETPPVVDER